MCAGVIKVTPKITEISHVENVRGILERQWSTYKFYVVKCKLEENSHTLVTG